MKVVYKIGLFFAALSFFLLLLATRACSQEQSTILKFGDREIIVQGSVPTDLPTLPAKGFTMYSGDDFEIMIWSCKDPKNLKSYWYYVIAYQPQAPRKTREIIMIYCDQEMGGVTFWSDEEYFNGKPASRVLTQQKKKPDLQKLILMRKSGFKYEV